MRSITYSTHGIMSIETQLGTVGILPTSYHTTIINRAAEELAVETNEQSTIIQELINRMNLPDPIGC